MSLILARGRALLWALFAALSTFQAAAVGFSYGIDPADNQAVFTERITQRIDSLLRAGAGEVLGLAELRRKAGTIRFTSDDRVFTVNNKHYICKPAIHAQWLTSAYDRREGRPTVVHLRMLNAREFTEIDWLLFFHEALSSLGVTDDEYQVSGPLLALEELAQETGKRFPALLQDPAYAHLGRGLALRLRTKAPTYNLDDNDFCWIFPEEGGRGAPVAKTLVAGTTSVGGGGYGLSLRFKADLLREARQWWNENRTGKAGFEDFYAKLSRLGIEPYGSDLSKMSIPAVIEYGSSKRTGALTAYLSLETLYHEKIERPHVNFSFPGEDGTYQRHSCRKWCGALEQVYRKIAPPRSR